MCENVVHGTEHDHENRKNGRMCLQSSTMSEHIEITPEIIEIRHYLHAHPERSFKEYETSAYIEKLLRAHDIEVLNNPLETGVVDFFDTPDANLPRSTDGPVSRGSWRMLGATPADSLARFTIRAQARRLSIAATARRLEIGR